VALASRSRSRAPAAPSNLTGVIDAETYDTYIVPAINEPWSRELIKRAQVWKGDRVLDVATGTGIVACRIAATGAAVTAIDPDAASLAQAKVRAAEENVSVKWLEGAAEALPFRTPAFELVTCREGLQFTADRALAAREMRRVIVPGGRAVISCWTGVAEQGVYAVLDALAFARAGKHFAPAFSLADPAELNKLLVDAKFFAINIETVTRQVRVPDPARFVRTPLGSLLGDAMTDEIAAEALEQLAPFIDGEQLVFPMTAMIATARVKT
jgi:ubiquinone/menaquinone biosynthesis C-methylase UbiE